MREKKTKYINKMYLLIAIFLLPLSMVTKVIFAHELSVVQNKAEKKSQLCSVLEENVVSSLDLVYYVKNCTLHLISDSGIFNSLILDQQKDVVPLSDGQYALLPIGKAYDYQEYYSDYISKDNRYLAFCAQYNNHIVTADNFEYYYIDHCHKRLFKNYSAISSSTKDVSSAVLVIPSEFLKSLPLGNKMPVVQEESLDFKKVTELQMLKTLPPASSLCKGLEHKVVSFYESFFFVEKCKLLQISDFNLDLQIKAEDTGGIKELTAAQMLGLPKGVKIKSQRVAEQL